MQSFGMKMLFVLIAAGSFWLVCTLVATAQTNDAATGTAHSPPVLKKTFSETPFLGTKSVLTLGGDYVKTPKEDYESVGIGTTPLSLEEMHGVIAEVGFGDATKQGEWQLRFRRKLRTMDSSWQAIADADRSLSLSDRRSQVLKASYNLRDWWQVGISALVEDKAGSENSLDAMPIGLRNGQSLGFQFDTLFKF